MFFKLPKIWKNYKASVFHQMFRYEIHQLNKNLNGIIFMEKNFRQYQETTLTFTDKQAECRRR